MFACLIAKSYSLEREINKYLQVRRNITRKEGKKAGRMEGKENNICR